MSQRKYKYTAQEVRLMRRALGEHVYAGVMELMFLAAQLFTILANAPGAWATTKVLYAKMIGNVISDENMPSRVKSSSIFRFLISIPAEHGVELLKQIDSTLDESDQQQLRLFMAEEEHKLIEKVKRLSD